MSISSNMGTHIPPPQTPALTSGVSSSSASNFFDTCSQDQMIEHVFARVLDGGGFATMLQNIINRPNLSSENRAALIVQRDRALTSCRTAVETFATLVLAPNFDAPLRQRGKDAIAHGHSVEEECSLAIERAVGPKEATQLHLQYSSQLPQQERTRRWSV